MSERTRAEGLKELQRLGQEYDAAPTTDEIVEAMAEAVRLETGCGYTIDGKVVLCCSPLVPDDCEVGRFPRSQCECLQVAEAIFNIAKPLIRNEALEEASTLADDYDTGVFGEHKNMVTAQMASEDLAKLIRSLKSS